MRRVALLWLRLLVIALACPALAPATEPTRDPSFPDGVALPLVDEPPFPDAHPSDRVRIWAGSTLVPWADFDGVELGLVRPELRIRTRLPLDDALNLQFTADFRANLYDTDGGGILFKDCVYCRSPDDLYAAAVGVQVGYLVNREWSFFRPDEQWLLVGAFDATARWEPGAFGDSISPGVSVGLGYQLPRHLRIALGARVERALDGDGVNVGPSAYFRWDFARKFRLRDRGIGIQIEYRPVPNWQLFLAGFRSSDRFRLDQRPGAPAGMTFRDRQVSVGGGVMVRISHTLRLGAEIGAIVDRRVSVSARDDGRLDSADGDVSPYLSPRAEVRL